MKERTAFVLILIAAFLTLIPGDFWAQPDQITLESPSFKTRERPPVPFPHLRHIEAGLSCKDCHHRYEKGENVIDEGELEAGKPGIRCHECHSSKSNPKVRDAFHRQCIDCHKKSKKGPLFCGECHRKK
jgi:c(7)-type cytochrome triheme protein